MKEAYVCFAWTLEVWGYSGCVCVCVRGGGGWQRGLAGKEVAQVPRRSKGRFLEALRTQILCLSDPVS